MRECDAESNAGLMYAEVDIHLSGTNNKQTACSMICKQSALQRLAKIAHTPEGRKQRREGQVIVQALHK